MNKIILSSLVSSAALLAACGGGGSSSSPTTSPPPPPAANTAPVVSVANNDQTAQVGQNFNYDATQAGTTFTDADGDMLTYSASFAPTAAGLTASAGVITGSPSQDGTITVTLTADDGNGGQVSDEFDVVINPAATPSGKPNIIFIISDDQGKDSSAQYALSSDLPNTPNLTAIADNGVIFENAWVSPTCSPTRAALMTGKYGVRTNVAAPGDDLAANEIILHQYLETEAPDYTSAMIGKWHLGGGRTGPNDFGVDYFAGIINGGVSDYNNWSLNINGTNTTSTNYVTTELTDLAINWVDQQTGPWLLWLSYNAPHTPYHLPPSQLHSRNLSGTQADIDANQRDYYLAAIEAMDTEFGRLWDGLSAQEQANTILVYLGDNGTPGGAVDPVVSQRGNKGGLFQGGINTPLFVSGPGITRSGAREEALVTHADLFPTLAELAGVELSNYFDGQSIVDLLSDETAATRDYAYTDHSGGWAIRNDRYKLIESSNGDQDLFDLSNDPAEETDLLDGAGDVSAILSELETEAARIRNVTNITGEKFSNLSPLCSDYVGQYSATAKDIFYNTEFQGSLETSSTGNLCTFSSNAIPNHDFNDGEVSFANVVGEVDQTFSFPTAPTLAAVTTPLNQIDNAIMLNGVKVDILSAGCFGVGDGRTGCNDPSEPWRYDPMFPGSGFRVDNNNAHAQPNGSYHYHGPPPITSGDENTPSGVIGFAADGFPIFGPYFDDNGTIRKAVPGYRLKEGSRPDGPDDPGGEYDGSFRADWEYVDGLGDLDECNGMTHDGQYGYRVTEAYPYILACFSGTPDPSFFK
jgi:arylsulfatase A-like enzyme